MDNLEQAIERHHLQPHPEGGWYREVYRSQLRIQRADGSERAGLTAILFALGAQQPSRGTRCVDPMRPGPMWTVAPLS